MDSNHKKYSFTWSFWGGPEIAYRVLKEYLYWLSRPQYVVTTSPRPSGRGMKLHNSPVYDFACQQDIKVFSPEKITLSFVDEIKKIPCDIALVVAYPRILGPLTRQCAKEGFINFHPSLLPLYRGPNPIMGALLDGCTETGVSVMMLDDGVDTGPILDQKKIFLSDTDNREAATEKILKEGVPFFYDTVCAFMEKKITPYPQDETKATYTKKISSQDEKVTLLEIDSEIFLRKVRAFAPFPGIWVQGPRGRFKIFSIDECVKNQLPAGLTFKNNQWWATTKDGMSHRVSSWQEEGKKRMIKEK